MDENVLIAAVVVIGFALGYNWATIPLKDEVETKVSFPKDEEAVGYPYWEDD